MYLIKRLWIDPLENRNAFGYEVIGFVKSKKEANRICNLEQVLRSAHPWPLRGAPGLKGESIPRFRAEEIINLNNMTLKKLKSNLREKVKDDR